MIIASWNQPDADDGFTDITEPGTPVPLPPAVDDELRRLVEQHERAENERLMHDVTVRWCIALGTPPEGT